MTLGGVGMKLVWPGNEADMALGGLGMGLV